MKPTQHKYEVFVIGFQMVELLSYRETSYIYVLAAIKFTLLYQPEYAVTTLLLNYFKSYNGMINATVRIIGK